MAKKKLISRMNRLLKEMRIKELFPETTLKRVARSGIEEIREITSILERAKERKREIGIRRYQEVGI